MSETLYIEGIMGTSLRTCGQGSISIEFKVNNKVYSVTLQDVKHPPNTHNNIISIRHLTNNGNIANFTNNCVEFKSKNSTMFGMGQNVRQIYQMCIQVKGQGPDFSAATKGHLGQLDQ